MARADTVNKPRGGKAIGRSQCAVGYVRRSTDRQEQSIPDQKRAIEQHAEEHGLRLLRFYVDDAISGTSTVGRQAFQDLIEDAKQSTCDFGAILVYDVKRFGRIDNDEAGYYRHVLRQHGVEVFYVSEGFLGDSTDDLIRPVKQWQARQESKDLSKVVIRGLLSKSESGGGCWMGGAPPYGYDLRYESRSGEFLFILRYLRDGTKEMFNQKGKRFRTLDRGESVAVSRRDQCRLVPSASDRVETIGHIFTMYAVERRGYTGIAAALNHDGVPTSRGPEWSSHHRGKWSSGTVRSILTNPAYAGVMVWNRHTDARFHRIINGRASERKGVVTRRLEPNDESDWIVIPDAHEPLVSRRLFEAAKALRTRRGGGHLNGELDSATEPPANGEATGGSPANRGANGQSIARIGPRAKFLLSQLCTCAHCGNRYEGHTQYRSQRDGRGERLRAFEYACGGYIRHGRSVCKIRAVPKELFEEAVIAAVLAYYARYRTDEGEATLAGIFDEAIGADHKVLAAEQKTAQAELRAHQRTMANLLDNITPVNRELIDARIGELQHEKARLEDRLHSIEHLAISGRRLREARNDLVSFIDGMRTMLRSGPLDQRQATIRRCVSEIVIDHATRSAVITIRRLPLLDISLGHDDTETLTIHIATRHARRGPRGG